MVVTGAGNGIGLATAHAFAAAGDRVVAADIDAEGAERTRAAIRARGQVAYARQVDVADAAAMETFAASVRTEHGVPDVVVNNAGIAISGPFLAHTAEDWRRIVDVNLLGVVYGCRLFGTQMVDRVVDRAEADPDRPNQTRGHIVNVASAAAYLPSRGLPAYSTTKAAVKMLSECLRAEFAEHRIGVSAICPGFVRSGIYRGARYVGASAAEQDRRRQLATEVFDRVGRSPDTVARAILRAVRSNHAVVPVTPMAWAGYALSRVTPGTLRLLAARTGDDRTFARLERMAAALRADSPDRP